MGKAKQMGNSFGCRQKDSKKCETCKTCDFTDNYEFTSASFHPHRCGCSLKAVHHPSLEKRDKNAKIGAVVVTISDGGSYDAMFTEIPQESEPGTRVAVYHTSSNDLPAILAGLRGEPAGLRGEPAGAGQAVGTNEESDTLRQLIADINVCDNDCVVFNWECCGGCGDNGFAGDQTTVISLMKCLLDRGSMVMCSDFSLKALIRDWDTAAFGPNPFVQIGTFNHRFKLHFEPAVLKECVSSQLQNVGSLCEDKGFAVVSAMSDTIAYTVDPAQTQHGMYKPEVLSVATDMSGFNLENGLPVDMRCEVKNVYGAAGHVLLTYPSGGTMLVSAGHWLELMQLDVSVESLRTTAMKSWGREKTYEMMGKLDDRSLTSEEHSTMLQKYAHDLVTSSAPCQKRLSKKLTLQL